MDYKLLNWMQQHEFACMLQICLTNFQMLFKRLDVEQKQHLVKTELFLPLYALTGEESMIIHQSN